MSRTLFNRYSFMDALACLGLVAGLACAASKDARPSPSGEVIPPEGAPSASSTAQGLPGGASAVTQSAQAAPTSAGTNREAAASSTAKGVGKDSAPDPRISVPTVKGRTRRDSLELVKAVRAGLKDPNWPARTPPPLPGSILPAHRIVAFYGNPLSKKMGILGELPPDQMLAQIGR